VNMVLLNNLVALVTRKQIFRGAMLLACIVLCLTHLCSAQDSNPSETNTDTIIRLSSAELRCGIDAQEPEQRAFADQAGKNHWRQYRSAKYSPSIQASGQLAQLWTGRDGKVLIRLLGPAEDWMTCTQYCFNKAGRLIAVRFQVRTAWGWGYREDGPVTRGAFAPQTSEFFSTSDESPITRPEMAGDIPDALKPHLYLRISRLPFAKFLRSWPH